MYFDPLSAWLVALIADGTIIAGEKFGGRSAMAEYDKKRIKERNEWLNNDIRRLKEKFELVMPEHTYERIQTQIKIYRDSVSFTRPNDPPIVIDLDNQEYIISLLEECSKRYSQYSNDEFRQKSQWFKSAAVEARRRKEQYAKELEETRIREAKEREKQQTTSNILLVIGLVIFIAFIIFFFS